MEVQKMMVHEVKTCHAHDSLNVAAQIMWEYACGSVPVVDEQRRPIGFLTDRDICMAAYAQGVPLQCLRVETAMARNIISCHVDDDVGDAARIMRETGSAACRWWTKRGTWSDCCHSMIWPANRNEISEAEPIGS